MSPGELLDAMSEYLSPEIVNHPDFAAIRAYFALLGPDIAAYTHYLEHNLLTGEVDVDFAFPTTIFGGMVRLEIEALFAELTRPLAPGGQGQRLLQDTLERVRAAETQPSGVTIALDRLAKGHAQADVGFVFVDYMPEIAHGLDAFELVGGGDVSPLAPYVNEFRLGHAGSGWRNEKQRHKAYVVGALPDLAAKADRGIVDERLDALAKEVGSDRRAHMVVDAQDGRAFRFGFELNFGRAGDPEYFAIVTRSRLWTEHISPERDRQILSTPRAKLLPDGETGHLSLSHLKVSFDGSKDVEWKAYYVLLKG